MGELGKVFDGLSTTWLGDLVASIFSFGGFIVIAAVLTIAFAAWLLSYVSKGAGQIGIIEGYVGTIGAGKTTLAVQHALELAKARDAELLSNIPIFCGPNCKSGDHLIHHSTLPMGDSGVDIGALTTTAFRLRDEGRGLVLLMDEVGVVMPARLWKDFPVSLMWTLQQSRKLACEWIWTAQDPTFVDNQLRSLTACVWYVRSTPPPSIWRRIKGKRPWLLVASAYTPMAAPRANGEGQRTERRIARRMFRYRRSWESAFDTDGIVLPSRHVKGADIIIAAAGADRHAVASDFGSGMGGELDPGLADTPLGG